MELNFTLNTDIASDVKLAADTLAYMSGFLPSAEVRTGLARATTLAEATQQAASEPTALPASMPTPLAPIAAQPQPPRPEVPKPVKKAKKEMVTPPVTEMAVGKLDIDAVKAKLRDYCDDARFGLNGVHIILARYGIARVTALPEARYDEFVAEINNALAG